MSWWGLIAGIAAWVKPITVVFTGSRRFSSSARWLRVGLRRSDLAAWYPRGVSVERATAEGSERIWDALRRGSDFFMGKGDVQGALRAVVKVLEEAAIPYAVVGAMALNRYGH